METITYNKPNEAIMSQERSAQIQNALISPRVEQELGVQDYGVQVFGEEHLNTVMEALTMGRGNVTLEVGMNAFIPPTPGLLAYLEMGMQRLKGLHDLGCSNVRLRLFDTASLRTSNNPSQEVKRECQRQQRDFFQKYINIFYPYLSHVVNLCDIEQELHLSQNIDGLTQEIHQQSEHDLQLNQALVDVQKMGERHGDNGDGLVTPIQYAAMHSHSDAFGYKEDKGLRIAIGCAGEVPFNVIRHTFSEPNEPQPAASLVVHGVLSRTAPYLNWKNPNSLKKSREPYPHDEPIGVQELIELYKKCPEHWGFKGYLSSNYGKGLMQIPQIREILYLDACVSQFPNSRNNVLDFLRQLSINHSSL